jgi:hypothetical protein
MIESGWLVITPLMSGAGSITCCAATGPYASSLKAHGSMDLASNTAPGLFDDAVQGGRHPFVHGVADAFWISLTV